MKRKLAILLAMVLLLTQVFSITTFAEEFIREDGTERKVGAIKYVVEYNNGKK